ncbi:MAG: EamA family transporter [Aggregatilineales bacterium]
MSWYVAALVSALALSGQALFFQRLQKHYAISTYMTYVWLGTAGLLAALFLRASDIPSITENIVALVLAALASFFGQYAYNQSIKTQNNIGYIEVVVAVRTAITYVFSFIAFNAAFESVKLVGVIIITVGVLIVAEAFPFQHKEEPKNAANQPEKSEKSGFQIGWLGWAMIAALMFTVMPIFVRFATDNGTRPEVALVVVLVVAGLFFLMWSGVAKTSLKIARPHIMLIVIAIAFATVGNAADFISFQKTPNLAYAIAISNTRMIILYIMGMILFAEKFEKFKGVGIILTFIGVIALSLEAPL